MISAYKTSSYSAMSLVARRMLHGSSRTLKSSSTVESTTKTVKETGKKVQQQGASTAASSSKSFAEKNPFVFQLGVATVKTAAADLMAQVVAEGKSFDEIDWKRNGVFVLFGFSYLGGFQYFLMVNKYRQWFPTMDRFAKLPLAEKLKDRAGLIDAAKMVVFDIVIHLPVIYFPTYYTVKEFVGGSSWNPADWVQNGVSKYIHNSKEDLTAMVQLWLPSDCVQFMLPVHIRLPFRHLVSFFWTAYVSFTRGAIDDKKEE